MQRQKHIKKSQGHGQHIMTLYFSNKEIEVIEQLNSGNWVVRNLDTGKVYEVSNYYLENIYQDPRLNEAKKLAQELELGLI